LDAANGGCRISSLAQRSDEKAGGASFAKDCELIANLAGNKASRLRAQAENLKAEIML
jgi:hypothetical protein